MASHIEVHNRDELLAVIQGAASIGRHVEFFRWLQDEVSRFLPHDVLVAAWGDFSSGRLNYDVASNIPEIHTQHIASHCDADHFMGGLYRRWRAGGERWYVLDDCASLMQGRQGCSCITALVQMKSILVHGVRDRRANHDCLYAFFDRDYVIDAHPAILEVLLPHVDSVLRRVECLAPVPRGDASASPTGGISEREWEILGWLRHGKTNHEIGLILDISPNTVKNHLKRIYHKLQVSSRAQAVAKYAALARD